MRLYVLDEQRQPVTVDSFDKWHEWIYDNNNKRTVLSTILDDGTHILTVFLAHSTAWSDEANPHTFQTMIVGGDYEKKEKYYTSWMAAEEGHKKIVAEILATDPEWPMDIEVQADKLMDFYGVIH